MKSLEEIDQIVEELGIEIMTPSAFQSERRRLERRFMEIHCLAPTMINPSIRDGDIQDCDLVQEWIDLMALEPYVAPKEKRRRPPQRKSEESQQGRESGLFHFWSAALHLLAAYTGCRGRG